MVLEHAGGRRGVYGSWCKVASRWDCHTSGIFAIVTLLPENKFRPGDGAFTFLISPSCWWRGRFHPAPGLRRTPEFEAIKARQDISQ